MPSTSGFLRAYEQEMAKYVNVGLYHRACALTIFGALLTRQKYRTVLAQGVPPFWTNLWTILVGESGSGKSMSIRMAEQILTRIDESLLAPHKMSPEAFLGQLEERERSNEDPTTIFVQSEFANLLANMEKKYATDLKSLLMDLFDVPPIWKDRLVRRKFELHQPRASLLGGITVEQLANHSQTEDWLGGFFSRCLIISNDAAIPDDDVPTIDSAIYDRLARHLNAALAAWKRAQIRKKRTAKKWPLMELSKEAKKAFAWKMPDEQNARVALARARVHFAKIAAIEQIDEDPEQHVIGKAAAIRAREFIDTWAKGLPDIVDACFTRGRGEFEGDKLAHRVKRYLKRNGGKVRYRDLLRNCSCHTEQLAKSIQSLRDAEWVDLVEEETATKPRTYVVLLRDEEEKGPSRPRRVRIVD